MKKYIPLLVNLLVHFFHLSFRYKFSGLENLETAKKNSPSSSYVLGIWHQNLFAGITAQIGTTYCVIVSPSKDGELVAVTCQKFGNIPVRGSSSRGGKKAMAEMIDKVKEGYPAAITVDGPKGPAHSPKRGIIEVAKQTGAPIIPYVVYPVSHWTFEKAWDKFRLPKLFCKVMIHYCEPIFVPEDCTIESYEKYSEALKNELIKGEKVVKTALNA